MYDFVSRQLLKYPGSEKQTYYPTPVTLLNPNPGDRNDAKCLRGNMVVSSHTADTTKNLERDQWSTTYDRNHTGLGPTNPYQLNNYYEKLGRDDDDDTLVSNDTSFLIMVEATNLLKQMQLYKLYQIFRFGTHHLKVYM